jgi:hypothetical protein
MIVPRYEVRRASFAEGLGIYLLEDVNAGTVIVAPDAISKVFNGTERAALKPGSAEDAACVRWFEDWHTVSTDWPDDCYINHSFSPTGLWHLGFVFATQKLKAGTELTVDYRFLINDAEELPFVDAVTGEKIIGLSWAENIRQSTRALLDLLGSGNQGK